jgi:hypothetical protein
MVGGTCLWYRLIIGLFGTGWCMVDALVYGTYLIWLITGCLVYVGAWLMHLFMVQVDYRLRYRLMHG